MGVFHVFKLCKWYQIAQRTTYDFAAVILLAIFFSFTPLNYTTFIAYKKMLRKSKIFEICVDTLRRLQGLHSLLVPFFIFNFEPVTLLMISQKLIILIRDRAQILLLILSEFK